VERLNLDGMVAAVSQHRGRVAIVAARMGLHAHAESTTGDVVVGMSLHDEVCRASLEVPPTVCRHYIPRAGLLRVGVGAERGNRSTYSRTREAAPTSDGALAWSALSLAVCAHARSAPHFHPAPPCCLHGGRWARQRCARPAPHPWLDQRASLGLPTRSLWVEGDASTPWAAVMTVPSSVVRG
jgi:hypothetical protein